MLHQTEEGLRPSGPTEPAVPAQYPCQEGGGGGRTPYHPPSMTMPVHCNNGRRQQPPYSPSPTRLVKRSPYCHYDVWVSFDHRTAPAPPHHNAYVPQSPSPTRDTGSRFLSVAVPGQVDQCMPLLKQMPEETWAKWRQETAAGAARPRGRGVEKDEGDRQKDKGEGPRHPGWRSSAAPRNQHLGSACLACPVACGQTRYGAGGVYQHPNFVLSAQNVSFTRSNFLLDPHPPSPRLAHAPG